MGATASTRSEGRLRPARVATASGPIIVASDGTDASEPGIAAARVLSSLMQAPVQLISIVTPLNSLLPASQGTAVPSVEDRHSAEIRLEKVREQQRAAGSGGRWTAEIKFGDPATVLTRLAKSRNARLIVMGRRPHGRKDQLLGDDTVFDVMRLSETPVLVVTGGMKEPPKVITVAVDFGQLSSAAARTAVRLFPDAGLVYLVHVRPGNDVTGDVMDLYGSTVREGFERLVKELDPHTGARIDTVDLSGVPAREIVDFAESSRSELLVVGSYRRGLFRRLAGGAMASRLMRGATTPVLIVPEAATEDVLEHGEQEAARATMSDQAIAGILDEITRRNAGRRVMFEADTPRSGAQLLAFDFTLMAAEFSRTTGRTHIVLSDDPAGSCQSVTHALGRPHDVDIRRALDGSDHVVRIVDDCGQATLTFW
jgi:nucleotide-binding universal stress UspA family protein